MFIGFGFRPDIVPVEDTHISGHPGFLVTVLILPQRQLARHMDHPSFRKAGFLNAAGNQLVAGAGVERSVLLRSKLLVDCDAEGAELAIVVPSLDLRITD